METQCEECRGPLQAFTTQVAARKERGLLCRSCFEQKLSVGAPVARQRGTRTPVRVGTGPSASSDSFWNPFRWTPRDLQTGIVDAESSDFPVFPPYLHAHEFVMVHLYENGDPLDEVVNTSLFKYEEDLCLNDYIVKACNRPINRNAITSRGARLASIDQILVFDMAGFRGGREQRIFLRLADLHNKQLGKKIHEKSGFDSYANLNGEYPLCYNFEVGVTME